jgi:hypothetical protein
MYTAIPLMLIITAVKTDLEQAQVVTSNSDCSRVFSDDVLFINLCSTAYIEFYGNITVFRPWHKLEEIGRPAYYRAVKLMRLIPAFSDDRDVSL